MSNEKKSVRSGRFDDPTREEASYRERLESSSLLLGEDEEQSPEAAQPDVEALRMLVESTGRKGTAFQSVAVAAVQILERALCYEREAAEAAPRAVVSVIRGRTTGTPRISD